MIKELENELVQLKSAIADGDETAIARADEIVNVEIPRAKRSAEILAKMENSEVHENMNENISTLGEFAVKNLDLSGIQGGSAKSAGTDFGYKANTDIHTTPTVTVTEQNVVDVTTRELTVRDLLGAEVISGNAFTYFQMGTTEGTPGEVAEGGTKPQIHIPTNPVTVPLTKVAAWFYESDELLSDAPFMASAINNRGIYEHNLYVENYLVNAISSASGIQTITPAGSTLTADDIFKAITAVRTGSRYAADALIINPADYETLRLAKDSNLQYYGGGYFYAPYGNGQIVEQPGIWGLRTVVTTAVPAGTVLVGAFKAGGSVVTKDNEGLRVEVATQDQDDFIKNLVTVRIEERMALALRVPAAFVKVAAA